MRVSENQRYWIANNRINKSRKQNADALLTLSTQKRVNHLHDDPIAASGMVKNRDRLTQTEAFKKTVLFSKGFLDVSENAIAGIQDRLMRARELAIAMANDTYAADSREATAREVKEIINEVIQLGNSSYNNRFVFSGFRTTSPPLDNDGVYLGDDGVIYLEVESRNFRPINISARDLFQATGDEIEVGHFNMVDALDALYDGLMASDKDLIYKSIDEIGYQLEKTSSFQSIIGSMWTSLNKAEERLGALEAQEKEFLSRLEDADAFQSSSDFKRTETVLQSTLLASNKLLQPSLFNFMQ